MTPWVMRIIIANVAVFLAQQVMPGLDLLLGFYPAGVLVRPWTPFTYMFVHGGWGHIFWNMLTLYFFGPRLETVIGGKRFLGLYVVSGLSGAALSFYTPHALIIGASGAVFGIELAYARYWPRDKIYLYFAIPIEARWLVVIMTVLTLFGASGHFQPGVAHFAHLGGFLGGALYLYWMERHNERRKFQQRATWGSARERVRDDDVRRWQSINRDALHELNRREVDRLLDKISAKGVDSLTEDEKAALDRFSRQ